MQYLREQFVFTGEVVVDGALRYPGGGSDLVHAGGLETAGAELGNGGVHDGLALTVGELEGQVHAFILHRLVYFFKNQNYTV